MHLQFCMLTEDLRAQTTVVNRTRTYIIYIDTSVTSAAGKKDFLVTYATKRLLGKQI